MNIKIYMEEGGSTKALKTRCREGFSKLLCKAGLEGQMPQIIADGAREKTFDDFRTALKTAEKKDFIVLLVDSEKPVEKEDRAWTHLKSHDDWDKPEAATDDSAHLMVQCMESWFFADEGTLKAFFGKGFKSNALGKSEVENIAKADLFEFLKLATRGCDSKGDDKRRHSFEILAKIDPGKVKQASPHAERLVKTLIEKANA